MAKSAMCSLMSDEGVKKLLHADVKAWLSEVGDGPFKTAVVSAAEVLVAKMDGLEQNP